MADLLIRGASLPKDKEQIFVIFPDGVVNVVEKGTPYYEAVEVPEHGPLIDADELRAEHGLGGLCENCPVDKRYCQYEMTLTKMEVCGWVDDAKIIIPASQEDAE